MNLRVSSGYEILPEVEYAFHRLDVEWRELVLTNI